MAALYLATPVAQAATLTVSVLDTDGAPVPNVAVFVHSDALDARPVPTAVMDQQNVRFVPHILVVEEGTLVEFPNNDEVAHHVYSFSKPNEFKLPIYKGQAHDPVRFDHEGLVTLGCNIHDQMLAYLLVVDTPVFAKTDTNGIVSFTGDRSGDASVSIWSPRIKDSNDTLTKTIGIPATGDVRVVFSLQRNLRRAHDHDSDALSWSSYE